jgi:predicted cobalt transporter CbtA
MDIRADSEGARVAAGTFPSSVVVMAGFALMLYDISTGKSAVDGISWRLASVTMFAQEKHGNPAGIAYA